MLAGHLAAGLILKKMEGHVNLRWLFFATLFHDFLAGPFSCCWAWNKLTLPLLNLRVGFLVRQRSLTQLSVLSHKVVDNSNVPHWARFCVWFCGRSLSGFYGRVRLTQ